MRNVSYNGLKANVRPDYGSAMALATSLAAFALVAVVAFQRFTASRDFTTVSGKGVRVRRANLGKSRHWFSVYAWGFVALSVVVPMGATLYGSFQGFFGAPDSGITAAAWHQVLGSDTMPALVRNTIVVAATSAAIIIVIGTAVALVERRGRGKGLSGAVSVASWLPWMFPGLVLGIGLLWLTADLIGLADCAFLVMIITFSIIYVPLGVRQVAVGLSQIGNELQEASSVSGFGPAQTFFRITVRLVLPSLAATSLLCFALIARDTNTALFIYSSSSETLGIRAVTSWREGSTSTAAVYGLLITVVNAVALLLFVWITRRTAGQRYR